MADDRIPNFSFFPEFEAGSVFFDNKVAAVAVFGILGAGADQNYVNISIIGVSMNI